MSDPSSTDLARIQWWVQGSSAWLDFVADVWVKEYGGVGKDVSPHEAGVLLAERDDRFLRLATGGWSGNEEIISTMRKNVVLWMTTWRLSACGGLHIFRYPRA